MRGKEREIPSKLQGGGPMLLMTISELTVFEHELLLNNFMTLYS